ncbi:MAG: hypothetical protein ACFFED_13345 [Candidatus Thorarchaeota archaeon]
MTEPIEHDYAPSWYYYGLIFLTIIIWTILSVEIINLLFGLIVSDSIVWLMLSSMLIFSYSIPIAILIWRMKMSIELLEPEWEYKERFVTFNEFRNMCMEYKKKYAFFTSRIDYRGIFSVSVVIVLALFIPLLLTYLGAILLALLPQVFGAFMIILGILYASILYAGLPSPLYEEFPILSPTYFGKALSSIYEIPALSWIGIRLRIGEWHGYYTLREPVIAAKIENLESATTVLFYVDSRGIVESVQFSNESSRNDFPKDMRKSYPSSFDIVELLRGFVLWYANALDDKELLDETLDELGIDSSG